MRPARERFGLDGKAYPSRGRGIRSQQRRPGQKSKQRGHMGISTDSWVLLYFAFNLSARTPRSQGSCFPQHGKQNTETWIAETLPQIRSRISGGGEGTGRTRRGRVEGRAAQSQTSRALPTGDRDRRPGGRRCPF